MQTRHSSPLGDRFVRDGDVLKLRDRDGLWWALDPWQWRWREAERAPVGTDDALSAADALRWLHETRRCRLVPVSVVGPRDPSNACRETAYAVGRALGALALPVLCGGKTGVMEAVARGVSEAGGLSIGMVPDNAWDAANDFVALPLATGLGPARNILVARACVAMVAVGGQFGTITEVAYARHFDKPVFGLDGAPDIDGVTHLDSVEAVVEALVPILLRLDQLSDTAKNDRGEGVVT